MKNVPLVAKIGFLIFCIVLVVLWLIHLLNFKQIYGLLAMGLFAFGIIRIFKEKKQND
jgi:hypothetical protein